MGRALLLACSSGCAPQRVISWASGAQESTHKTGFPMYWGKGDLLNHYGCRSLLLLFFPKCLIYSSDKPSVLCKRLFP